MGDAVAQPVICRAWWQARTPAAPCYCCRWLPELAEYRCGWLDIERCCALLCGRGTPPGTYTVACRCELHSCCHQHAYSHRGVDAQPAVYYHGCACCSNPAFGVRQLCKGFVFVHMPGRQSNPINPNFCRPCCKIPQLCTGLSAGRSLPSYDISLLAGVCSVLLCASFTCGC